MRAKLLAASVAVVLGLGLGQSAAAGGWDESSVTSGVIHVPTAVYYPAPRHKRCARRFQPRCHAGPGPNAHSYVVYRYAGTGYPRYHYRWRGYGWNR